MPISLRYPLVEMLTAVLYLAVWARFGLPSSPAYWIFLCLMVAATFIDIDHLIIPDEITLGGTAAGVVAAGVLPGMVGADNWWSGVLWSLVGAAAGYLLLWGVVEGGKKAFGVLRIRPEVPEPLEISLQEGRPVLVQGDASIPLEEMFYRPSDRIEARMAWLEIHGENLPAGDEVGESTLSIDEKTLSYGECRWAIQDLGDLLPVRGEFTELRLPREAMGFGDVKFLACIGAFLGWKGVIFSLFAASITGAVAGIAMLVATRGSSGGRVPFGPYLALGALIWLLGGPEVLGLYASWLRSEAAFFLLRHGLPV